jgi:hypothetical protein
VGVKQGEHPTDTGEKNEQIPILVDELNYWS